MNAEVNGWIRHDVAEIPLETFNKFWRYEAIYENSNSRTSEEWMAGSKTRSWPLQFEIAKKEGWLEVEHEDGLNQVTCQSEIVMKEEWLEAEHQDGLNQVTCQFEIAKEEEWLEAEHEDGLNQVTCQSEIAMKEEWLEAEHEVDFHLLTWLEIEHET